MKRDPDRNQDKMKNQQSEINIYRPHPKDDGKVLFSVCQSTPGGGGTPSQV